MKSPGDGEHVDKCVRLSFLFNKISLNGNLTVKTKIITWYVVYVKVNI